MNSASTVILLWPGIMSRWVNSSHWLAEANEASERGDKSKAEKLYEKSQYWLDRANKLLGND